MARRWLIGLLLCLAPAALAAQAKRTAPAPQQNPALLSYEHGIRDATHASTLGLRRFDMKVEMRGAVAETTITAEFENPGDEELEGDFRLELPAGAIVTGYALDIDGALIDGVLVDRPKAEVAYEARVRRGVDPGLAEVADGAFHTRVFPIPAGEGRTIRLRFTAPATDGFSLPLRFAAPSGGWSIAVRASGMAAMPALIWPTGSAMALRRDGDAWVAAAEGRTALTGRLSIARPALPDAVMSRNRLGERYLQLSGFMPGAAALPRANRVRIYWDRSRSRLKDDHQAEFALLRATLARLKPRSIELVTFNSSGASRAVVADAEAVIARLRTVRYRGAASFAPIAGDSAPADRCLIFSRGRPSVDFATTITLRCRLDGVAAPTADTAWLRHLTADHGGRVFAPGGNPAVVAAAIASGGPVVTAVLDDRGTRLPFFPIADGKNGWRLIARAPDSGNVRIRIGRTEIRRAVPGPDAAFDGEGALLAADALAVLSGTAARADYVALSRRYGIASPSLSFVVLETPDDYIEADIAPPDSYPEKLLKDYREQRRDKDEEKTEAVTDRLDEVVDRWEEQVAWWKDPKADSPEAPAIAAAPPPSPAQAPPPPPPPAGYAAEPSQRAPVSDNSAVSAQADWDVGEGGDRDIMVTGVRRAPRISIDAWQPGRSYLRAFDRAPRAFDRQFPIEEAKGGGVPAFYLDTAEWLRRHGRRAEAIEMVLSALDLPLANEVTLGIVADRLERYGAIDRAVALRERQAVLDPARPQPKRLLALALARRAALHPAGARADLERAIDLLSEVALTPWEDDWDGIDMIALMEANALIPKLRALGGEIRLDKRLIALLDVDLRVVVDWTTASTDLDLWVDEPNGERAIYSNPRTKIGGHLSNDMTDGYGPEEYLLRQAPAGPYLVQANVYASDAIDPNGLSLITAHLIRDFGRPTQHEESVDIELKRDDEGAKRIGRIVVPGAARGKR
ncbi:VIT domain-containing protein [Sphingomonas sp. ZT3P38]|uniref:VIT domain-containing protein n=1 Tax=Parasphingomonas zepuensis TaxID=3096161 RepID=UPI002FC9BDE6